MEDQRPDKYSRRGCSQETIDYVWTCIVEETW